MIHLLNKHSIEYIVQDGELYALGVFSSGYAEWVLLTSYEQAYSWLGY